MYTFEQLFNAAQEKGFKVDAFTTYLDRWGDKVRGPETFISIQIREYIWFTWYFIDAENPTYAFFKGRYSQRNGATQKTFKKEHNALVDLGLEKVKF